MGHISWGGSLSSGRSGIKSPVHPFASQNKIQGSPLGSYLSKYILYIINSFNKIKIILYILFINIYIYPNSISLKLYISLFLCHCMPLYTLQRKIPIYTYSLTNNILLRSLPYHLAMLINEIKIY